MILILTNQHDRHADHIVEILKQRGNAFIRFDPGDFPDRCSLEVSYGPRSPPRKIFKLPATSIDTSEITSVWHRRPSRSQPSALITDSQVLGYIARECDLTLQDLWSTLACKWLPGQPVAGRRAEYKGLQLQVACELGLEVPETLITTSRAAFLEFYRQHGGNIISKLASPAFHTEMGPHWIRYTEPVTTRDIIHCSEIGICPAIVQAYIPKRLELRITVVGRRVFAAEIHSQENHHTKHDWRHYDLSRTPHRPHELPIDIAARCISLTEQFGLCYGAIDMILTPDGRYIFLEINPNGQYLWIEEQTGLPISDALCDLLSGREHNLRNPIHQGFAS